MERALQTPDTYDFRDHDQMWRRVAPTLEPYPGFQSEPSPRMAPLPGQTPGQPETPGIVPPPASGGAMLRPGLPSSGLEQLPGAQADPCCMGTAAAESLAVLTGFIEVELADRRYFQAFARQAPSWARQTLRDMAADGASRAKRLMAVYYLITGKCYQPSISTERIFIGRWCAALRERYHVAACNGMNYLRAAEETTDPCLTKLLTELSQEAYHQADHLLALLERAL